MIKAYNNRRDHKEHGNRNRHSANGKRQRTADSPKDDDEGGRGYKGSDDSGHEIDGCSVAIRRSSESLASGFWWSPSIRLSW